MIYGKDTKNVTGYLTNYQNKDPLKSYNMSALLGSALMYHQNHLPQQDSLREQNQLLIYRCFNVLNRQAELSGPQVISYLMNWGDRFISHQYVSIFWTQLASALNQVHPSLRNVRGTEIDDLESSNTLLCDSQVIFRISRRTKHYIEDLIIICCDRRKK